MVLIVFMVLFVFIVNYGINYGELWEKQVNYSKTLWERFTKNEFMVFRRGISLNKTSFKDLQKTSLNNFKHFKLRRKPTF